MAEQGISDIRTCFISVKEAWHELGTVVFVGIEYTYAYIILRLEISLKNIANGHKCDVIVCGLFFEFG